MLGVVVPAGGASRRYGAGDKLAADLGGRSVLDRTLDSVPAGLPVVCVGAARATGRQVVWTQEQPSGAGPLSAVAAGIEALPDPVDLVALLGGDMPGAGRLLPSLAYALDVTRGAADVAVAVDAAGIDQPLLAVWRRKALQARLAALGDPTDQAVRALLDGIGAERVQLTRAADDVDTPEDLERARRRLSGPDGVDGRPGGDTRRT